MGCKIPHKTIKNSLTMKVYFRQIETIQGNYINMELMLYSSPHYSDYIGSLTMQKNKGNGDWYALTYKTETNDFNKLQYLSKVAKYIVLNSDWNIQPNEIISLLDAKEIYLFKDVFVQVADKGKYLYKVMQDNELYKYIICANDIIASKQIKAGYELGARYLIE
jgi:hypothetical protein